MELRRQTRPGKFEGGLIIDELAYDLSLAGCDDDCGDASMAGEWHGLLYGPFKADGPFADIAPDMRSVLGLTDDELAYLASVAGCAIRVNGQGFVDVTWFDSREKLDSAWADLVAEFEADDDDTNESED